MKKLMTLLIMAAFISYAPAVFAEGIALSDTEMDEIAAGELALPESFGGFDSPTAEKFNANDILLDKESQTKIETTSNANAVDSAVAVQLNTSSATGNNEVENDIQGNNTADLNNYNPSFAKESWETGSESSSKTDLGENHSKTHSENNLVETSEKSHNNGCKIRNNKSENNHIFLTDTAQQLIKSISNLNSVGSAVAVQTNVAADVGVGGSILHSNTATAVNGL